MAVLDWPATRVRETFINFFQEKAYLHWKSSPVVPLNDPTLLFAIAGMNQFKPIFLGTVEPNTELSKLTRACNTQKCIRAGGKHNDLDDVGKDTYHHTFFEILGNWSFGDYFKKEAIQWAWELPPRQDNFWEMGDTGPCGPCTEIHFDRIGNRDAASFVNNDDPTVIEIWNLVFIQFNRESDGSLKSLPAKHVDTGMGFERLTSILQNKMSNYDADVFLPIFDAIQQATGARPYSGKVGPDDSDKVDMAYRVVADHIRTISFAIADGSCPGNEGCEYVLRRILRRAVRYGTEVLKAQQGFFNGLVNIVVEVMGDVFSELKQHAIKIRKIITDEEASFGRTLVKGIEKFMKAAQELQGTIHSGQDTFDLWDTYGFPLDLTQLTDDISLPVDGGRGLSVDVEGFNVAMQNAREKSRNAQNKKAGGTIVMDADATATLHKKGVAATVDSFKFTWFQEHSNVIKVIYTGSEFLESVIPGEEVGIILETTTFYAEQGGRCPDGVFEVSNVQIYGGSVVHIGSYCSLPCLLVNYDRRTLIVPNHTCTHMLNLALREVLGNHVDQKGSIVLSEKLRFDFSHGEFIFAIVNEQIKAELDVFSKETRLVDAKCINGLRAVFRKESFFKLFIIYPDPVRVVAIGKKVEDLLANPENEEWLFISAELCGGTHITNTRDAKALALLSEEGIAKGICRVTAVTMDCAFKAVELAASLDREVNEASKTEGSILEQKVTYLNNRVEGASIPSAKKADLNAEIFALQNIQKAIKVATQMAEVTFSNGKDYCVSHVNVGSDTAAIREAVVKVMEQKKVLDPISGKGGGGKGGLAQGQGSDVSRIETAIDVAESFAAMKLT
ncbi:hypothetical protein Pfo_028013 [Paulownia fortunei]|nr:hypothetical protein Pfo_028013 [Paulownia fortunei]